MHAMKTIQIICTFSLIISYTFADTSINTEKVHFLDTLHTDISEKVLKWSTYADIVISKWLGYDDLNETSYLTPFPNQIESKKVDLFFQNNKFIDETDDVFIRVRTDTIIQTRESNKLRLKFRAQLPFSRCRKQLKLFVEDLSFTKEKSNLNKNDSTDIGFRYDAKKRYGIKSRYSVGFSGISPFISARYSSLVFKSNILEIEPVQTFKYSNKYYFEEETNLYFDKTFENNALLRMTLQRGSKSTIQGMDYSLKFEYYTHPKKNKGWHFEQKFFGNTKYRHRKEKYRDNHPKNEFHGINNYATTISYRANIWRKWFYYEIKPGVNFHRDVNYKPNYSLRFFFDFYFGDYH